MALSLGLPPAAVSRHRVFMEPGLSSRTCARATVQPTGDLDMGGLGCLVKRRLSIKLQVNCEQAMETREPTAARRLAGALFRA